MSIEKLYTDGQFLGYCKALAGSLGEDLYSEALLIVLESDIKHDNIAGYFKRTAFYLWINPRSEFNKKFRPKQIDKETLLAAQDDSINEEYLIKESIMKQLLDKTPENKRERFVTEVFREYLEKGSCRAIAEDTGINYVTISKTVRKFKNKIDEIYRHRNS